MFSALFRLMRITPIYDVEPGADLDEAALDYMWGLLGERYQPTAAERSFLEDFEAIDAEIEELGGWVDVSSWSSSPRNEFTA